MWVPYAIAGAAAAIGLLVSWLGGVEMNARSWQLGVSVGMAVVVFGLVLRLVMFDFLAHRAAVLEREAADMAVVYKRDAAAANEAVATLQVHIQASTRLMLHARDIIDRAAADVGEPGNQRLKKLAADLQAQAGINGAGL